MTDRSSAARQTARSDAPVFVVGAPRSGTTMLAAMLASHPAFAAGPETQFFSKLAGTTLERAATDEAWPDAAVRLLSGLTLAGQPVVSLFESDESALHAYMAAREPSVAAMMESLTEPFAARRGKPRWVEKTPNHILNLDAIRRLWPDARIIRIMRDPRDVGLSTRKLPAFSERILPNIYLWREWNAAAEPFFESDRLAMTVRYEDIVDRAEEQLSRICDFLGEAYDPAMLAFARSAADVSSANEGWKAQVSDGLSGSRKYAWKNDLPAELRPVCDLVCHELALRHGYECGDPPVATRTAFRMSRGFIERSETMLVDRAERGERWLPAASPQEADRVVDHPEYRRFRDPAMLARLAMGRARSWRDRRGP